MSTNKNASKNKLPTLPITLLGSGSTMLSNVCPHVVVSQIKTPTVGQMSAPPHLLVVFVLPPVPSSVPSVSRPVHEPAGLSDASVRRLLPLTGPDRRNGRHHDVIADGHGGAVAELHGHRSAPERHDGCTRATRGRGSTAVHVRHDQAPGHDGTAAERHRGTAAEPHDDAAAASAAADGRYGRPTSSAGVWSTWPAAPAAAVECFPGRLYCIDLGN